MDENILAVKDLSVSFGSGKKLMRVVSHVSFHIKKGQALGLVGESGSGKSLTALAIMQLLPQTAAIDSKSKIFFHDQDILALSEMQMREIRGGSIAIIFQDSMSAFNPVLTIGNQLNEAIVHHLRYSKKQAKNYAYQLLAEVGITNIPQCYSAYPHELSGGMRQRAMIAMALCGNPKLLIADEPTTALDVTLQAQVLALLNKLRQQRNMSLLFISHDLAVIAKMADEIVVLKNGKMVETNTIKNFFEHPQTNYSKQLLQALLPYTPRYINFEMRPSLLRVRNLKVYFPIRSNFLRRKIGAIKAVDGIEFDVPKGQTLALVGESGSGKTTTAKTIINLIKATAGEALFDHKNLLALSYFERNILPENIQIVFQDPYSSLDPRMMVFDSLAEGLFAQKKMKTRDEAAKYIDELLIQVGVDPESKWRYPHEFSGGQRQRICIARAIALQPQLLILDEPTSALDVSMQMQILKLLEEIQNKYQLSYLLITHNLSVVAYMSHYTAVMLAGKIVEQGLTSEVLTNPQHQYTQNLLKEKI